jgi:hypothetical protein
LISQSIKKKKKKLAKFEALVLEVLKEHNAFTCWVKQSMKKYVYLILQTNALRSYGSGTIALTQYNVPQYSNL